MDAVVIIPYQDGGVREIGKKDKQNTQQLIFRELETVLYHPSNKTYKVPHSRNTNADKNTRK